MIAGIAASLGSVVGGYSRVVVAVEMLGWRTWNA